MCEEITDGFDRLPDVLILIIFNKVRDIKTLARCLSVSKRFNSLIPLTENLLLKVDCIISSETDDWFFLTLIRSIVKSLRDLISPKSHPIRTRTHNSPVKILRTFSKIKELEIELPSGDLRLGNGAIIRWRAEYGKSLKSCAILGFYDEESRSSSGGGDGERGLKERVVWTISGLIAASTWHYVVKDVVREHGELVRLVVRDRDGEGRVAMGEEGLREYREEEEEEEERENEERWRNRRTVIPAVKMKMRHEERVQVGEGVVLEGATLVVVKPCEDGNDNGDFEEGLGIGEFEGVYGEAVRTLLKSRSYFLEMNSF
ncbi:hypothetical protein RJ641_029672 [Dillenia turbinata]|uniref:F-box domain-containing protein n=1 Tax=Dillenia turbinata TaxID=194707 RepID=A0AAN8ZJH4_9MAGN